nr:chlorophyll(ide) b reductase nol, chloroplastic [Quercus suber]
MAMTPYLHFTTFPSLSSPLLFCKPHHPPFSQPPYLSTLQFNRYTFLSVSSRQNQKPFAVNFSSQIVNAESSSSSNTREPMRPPYNVLITGSTKGIGYALAKEFLQTGDNVIICSRSAERVESAVKSLREEFGEQHVWGTKCDVREGLDVKDLVGFAQRNLKYIDIWVLIFAAYGATKRSVVHLTKSLQAELQMQDVKNVVVHNLSPGMVTTDLLMSGATTKQAKFFINVLAEPAEVVAKSLVPNIRSVPASGSMKPTYIRFLTGIKAYSQIFSRFAFGARRNRYMPED